MRFLAWLQNPNPASSFPRGGRIRCPDRHARPQLEALEDRDLPSSLTVLNLADSGSGSLRDAVQQANAAAGPDTISFAAGLSGQITLTSGQLEISDATGPTTINGPGANLLAVNGANSDRVFQVDTGVTAAISGITISGGQAAFSGQFTYQGGGILNNGTLRLTNTALVGNAAGPVSSGGYGGAIFNAGTLTITSSTFSGNVAGNSGAIWNTGTLTLAGSTLSGNSAGLNGGGIYNGGTFTLTDSTLSSNSVLGGSGGGVFNDGVLTVNRSTFAQNSANAGGAIANYGTLNVVNSTFFGNSVPRLGGAIYIARTASATITNSTISGNLVQVAGQYSSGGIFNDNRLTINNSIVAGNLLTSGPTPTASDMVGTRSAKGSNNLIGTGGSNGLSARTNIVGVAVSNLHLASLGDYGGPTQTMALLAGCPAIDAGSNSLAVGPSGALTTDQRLLPRIVNAKVDIGAVEVQPIGAAVTASAEFAAFADSASISHQAVAQKLSRAHIEPLLAEAISRWQAAGVDVSSLYGIDVRIADLGGATLGMASGHTIWIDDNAAGWGWFVDPTPGDDSEFTTPSNQGEQHRMDLLTVLEHELGHLIGFDHQATGVMEDTLATGTRKMPTGQWTVQDSALLDLVFAGEQDHLRSRFF